MSEFFVHPSSYVDDGVSVGAGTKIWHFSHIMSGSRIGVECVLGQNVMVGPDVIIGDRVKVQNNVSVYAGVRLEDGVFCGPSVVFTNVLNPRAFVDRRSEFKGTVVRRGATLGANASIVCGVEIGSYAMVGAGAVVTSDLEPFGLYVGVPARRVGWVSRAGVKLGPDFICPSTGERYVHADSGLSLAE